jgi:hypothetical protein
MTTFPVEFSTLVERKCFHCKRIYAPGLSLFPPLGPCASLCRDCGKLQEFTLVTKTEAMKTYVLTDRDLQAANLMHVSRPNKHGKYPMKLFLVRQLEAAALNKHGALERVHKIREEKDQSRLSKKAKTSGGSLEDRLESDPGERLKILARGSSYGKCRASFTPPFHQFLIESITHKTLLARCDVVSAGHFSNAAIPGCSTFVLYIMQTALRAHNNPALDVALHLAACLGASVLVALPLLEDYPYANDRHG